MTWKLFAYSLIALNIIAVLGIFSLHTASNQIIKQEFYIHTTENESENAESQYTNILTDLPLDIMEHHANTTSDLSHQTTDEDNPPQFLNYFLIEEEAIIQDDYGHYIINAALKHQEETSIYIISESEVTFSRETQEPIIGCDMGGFYVNHGDTVSIIHEENQDLSVHHYHCSFDQNNHYYFNDIKSISNTLQKSINDILIDTSMQAY